MSIDARTVAIARLLCESEELHMTAGEIAEALAVSAKTVSRELPKVEQLLAEHGMRLEKKAGSGLWLEGGPRGSQPSGRSWHSPRRNPIRRK